MTPSLCGKPPSEACFEDLTSVVAVCCVAIIQRQSVLLGVSGGICYILSLVLKQCNCRVSDPDFELHYMLVPGRGRRMAR